MEKKVEPKLWVIVTVGVGIFGCFGAVTAALINKIPERVINKYFPEDPIATIETINDDSEQIITPNMDIKVDVNKQSITESQPIDILEPKENPEIIISNLRPHKSEAIGTGVFENAIYSDGVAEISQNELNSKYSKLQLINPNTTTSGCEISWYAVEDIWFSGASKTKLLVNGEEVGEIFVGNGKHGHIISILINIGDELCVDPIPPGGFHINLGPDMHIHYDSYCYRFDCEN